MPGRMARALVPVLAACVLAGCDKPATQPAGLLDANLGFTPGGESEPLELSPVERAMLRQLGAAGDARAMGKLIAYHITHNSEGSPDSLHWRLALARRGDCTMWDDLVFLADQGMPPAAREFRPGETIESIGRATGCARRRGLRPPAR